MARMLIISTHGSEDPTRAGIAFFLAKGAVEAGHRPEVVLAGDAAVLARKVVAESVLPVGIPPLKELIAFGAQGAGPHLRGVRPGPGGHGRRLEVAGVHVEDPEGRGADGGGLRSGDYALTPAP